MNNYIGVRPLETHFNSNCTFIALNLSYSKGTLRRNKTKTVNQFQYPGTEKRAKHHRASQGVSKTKVDMPWCTGRFWAAF